MSFEIYLDNNATSHLSAGVRDSLADALDKKFGNASSEHRSGQRTRRALSLARDFVAELLKTPAESIVFGSGATELNYWVMTSVLGRRQPAHLVVSQVEHSSVLETAAFLESTGVQVTRLPVSRDGRVELGMLLAAIDSDTALVSIQWVNNETGVIQPVHEIAEICAGFDVPFHCDAAQAVGKLDIDLSATNITYLTASAHKMHGPTGIGALYVRGSAGLRPLLRGGDQEKGLRPGTENTLGVIGFGQAARERAESLDSAINLIGELRDHFERKVLAALPEVEINGNRMHRVCNSTNMIFPGLDGAAIVALLDREGIRCSQSSACTSSRPEPSYVLRAMGLSEDEAFASVRFSFSDQNSFEDAEIAASKLIKIVSRLSKFQRHSTNQNDVAGAVKHEV